MISSIILTMPGPVLKYWMEKEIPDVFWGEEYVGDVVVTVVVEISDLVV